MTILHEKNENDRSASQGVVDNLEEFSSKLAYLKKLYDENLKPLKETSQDLIQLVYYNYYLEAGTCELTVSKNSMLLPSQKLKGRQQ